MKQITQKEFIKLLEDKQENARNDFIRATNMSNRDSLITNRAYIDAYQDLICYLNGVEIVPEKQNLAQVYSGKKVNVYTKNEIIGNRTPFEIVGKIISDSGANIRIKAEDGGYAIIDKTDINRIEIVPEEDLKKFIPTSKENLKKLEEDFEEKVIMKPFIDELKKIDPNKIPITPYVEPKVEPLRNDRFREFSFKMKGKTIVDAKLIKSISDDGGIFIDGDGIYGEDYNDLVEWWKYWKQN